MKNMNKRTKIILVVVGIVVVMVVIGLVITQPPTSELLGTTALVITPSNPTIEVPNSVDLSVNAVYDCAWSSSSPIVSLVNYTKETKWVTVQGIAEGTATITARCGFGVFNVNSATTSVQVTPRRTDGRQP